MKKKKRGTGGGAGGTARVDEDTVESFSGRPFKTTKELQEARDEVRYHVWRRMEEAKVMNEFIAREEYSFWREEFKEGLVCAYGEKNDLNLVRVYSEGSGIKIDINRSLAEVAPSSETVLGTLVEAMSKSFASTYYRAKGILPSGEAKKGDVSNDAER